MQRGDYNKLTNNLHTRRMALAVKKGADYAGYDILSNFKRMASIARTLNITCQDSFGYAIFMALLKIDRITHITGGPGKPENESIDDSFMDLHNYIDLARAILVEEGHIAVPEFKSKYTDDTGPPV
jgi:hypothetical protein